MCARLADEVRTYLAQHESSTGVPGKDRNDRLFDTWQEHGAVTPAPDGGAVWRVRVECDAWSPPDALTVLAFPLERVYPPGSPRPSAMRGRIWVPSAVAAAAAAGAIPDKTSATALGPPALQPVPIRLSLATLAHAADRAAADGLHPRPSIPAPEEPPDVLPPAPAVDTQTPVTVEEHRQAEAALVASERAAPIHGVGTSMAAPVAGSQTCSASSAHSIPTPGSPQSAEDDYLDPDESAQLELCGARATTTPELGAPQRPKERQSRAPRSLGGKGPSPAATALMAWVANGVGTGAITYNEEAAPIHFVSEGALLLTPEIFKRFLSEHEAVADGPIAALRASHGERAFRTSWPRVAGQSATGMRTSTTTPSRNRTSNCHGRPASSS